MAPGSFPAAAALPTAWPAYALLIQKAHPAPLRFQIYRSGHQSAAPDQYRGHGGAVAQLPARQFPGAKPAEPELDQGKRGDRTPEDPRTQHGPVPVQHPADRRASGRRRRAFRFQIPIPRPAPGVRYFPEIYFFPQFGQTGCDQFLQKTGSGPDRPHQGVL